MDYIQVEKQFTISQIPKPMVCGSPDIDENIFQSEFQPDPTRPII